MGVHSRREGNPSKGANRTQTPVLLVRGCVWGQPPLHIKITFAKNAQQRNAGQIFWRWRLRRVKRNKRDKLVLGTWNMLTILKPGKMQEIAEKIQNTTLQIVALQEIRWKGYGHIRKKDYSLYCSCNPDWTGHLRTGFLVKKEIEKNVLGFEPYN